MYRLNSVNWYLPFAKKPNCLSRTAVMTLKFNVLLTAATFANFRFHYKEVSKCQSWFAKKSKVDLEPCLAYRMSKVGALLYPATRVRFI